jgi:hypothetical protein
VCVCRMNGKRSSWGPKTWLAVAVVAAVVVVVCRRRRRRRRWLCGQAGVGRGVRVGSNRNRENTRDCGPGLDPAVSLFPQSGHDYVRRAPSRDSAGRTTHAKGNCHLRDRLLSDFGGLRRLDTWEGEEESSGSSLTCATRIQLERRPLRIRTLLPSTRKMGRLPVLLPGSLSTGLGCRAFRESRSSGELEFEDEANPHTQPSSTCRPRTICRLTFKQNESTPPSSSSSGFTAPTSRTTGKCLLPLPQYVHLPLSYELDAVLR